MAGTKLRLLLKNGLPIPDYFCHLPLIYFTMKMNVVHKVFSDVICGLVDVCFHFKGAKVIRMGKHNLEKGEGCFLQGDKANTRWFKYDRDKL
jgi:hypothetical protein